MTKTRYSVYSILLWGALSMALLQAGIGVFRLSYWVVMACTMLIAFVHVIQSHSRECPGCKMYRNLFDKTVDALTELKRELAGNSVGEWTGPRHFLN